MLMEKSANKILFAGVTFCLLVMLVIMYLGPYSEGFLLGPDQGNMWYYWKLSDPTVLTRYTA